MWTSMGKNLSNVGKRGTFGVFHFKRELSTKFSTGLSTRLAENYQRIHRPYYYYNLY